MNKVHEVVEIQNFEWNKEIKIKSEKIYFFFN